jgi:uncharacterized pyridoxal phosphate-containing UPF0001 family protein
MLEKNIKTVQERLKKAAAKRGVSADSINLVAVTKTVPDAVIRQAYALGLNTFGENRLQEALPKVAALPSAINWHFIGHLQTNKIKNVLPAFQLIHSLETRSKNSSTSSIL